MSAKGITDELVRQVANDLCARYGLNDEGMRALGSPADVSSPSEAACAVRGMKLLVGGAGVIRSAA